MTFEEANKILGDRTGGCDGCGCKLTRCGGKVFMVTFSSDDGGIGVEEIEDTEENWERIQSSFDSMKPFDKWDPKGEDAIEEAVSKWAKTIVSTSFWG